MTPPATWEELYETAKKLTDPSKNRYGFSFRGGRRLQRHDGRDGAGLQRRQRESRGFHVHQGRQNDLLDAGSQGSMELYLKLYKDASPPDSVNWGFQEQVQAFTSGVTGMLLQDPDVIQSLQEKMAEGTWATAPLQAGPTGKALLAAGGAGWGIAANSKHKEEAWKLVSFLSSPEENTRILQKPTA